MIKKVLFAALALAGSVSLANAQEIFQAGTKAVNVGVGLGSVLPNTTIPPLSVSFDYGVKDNLINGENGSISAGGYIGYTASSISILDSKLRTSYAILGARGAFHYQFMPKLDTYAGIMLGYRVASSSWSGSEVAGTAQSASQFDYSTYAGARYFFTDNIGAFAEAGYGVAYLNLGVTCKF